jgi:hypothetical protein
MWEFTVIRARLMRREKSLNNYLDSQNVWSLRLARFGCRWLPILRGPMAMMATKTDLSDRKDHNHAPTLHRTLGPEGLQWARAASTAPPSRLFTPGVGPSEGWLYVAAVIDLFPGVSSVGR